MTRSSRCLMVAAAIAVAVGGALAAGCRPSATPPLESATKPLNRTEQQKEFFGLVTSAPKIAYVIDRSGSMTDSIMYVKYELKRSIKMLRPDQSFHVLFYSTGPALEMPAQKLVPATEANKTAAYEFIDGIVPAGQTEPSSAIKRAFEVNPDVIYLLTDGEFEKNIVGLIDKLNPQRKVVVNTICFIYAGGEPLLKEIAEKNGGTYKYVGENDLEAIGRPERGTGQATP